VLVAHQHALNRWQLSESVIGGVDGANAHQTLHTNRVTADPRFEEVAPTVRPTSDELDLFF